MKNLPNSCKADQVLDADVTRYYEQVQARFGEPTSSQRAEA